MPGSDDDHWESSINDTYGNLADRDTIIESIDFLYLALYTLLKSYSCMRRIK